jgi:hypothetical protein
MATSGIGVLAAMLLAATGVMDEDTVHDYSPFLALLRREYGSAAGYLEAQGADNSLPQRLEEALLV